MTDTSGPSRDRYAHLRAYATAQKDTTLARLTQAIAKLEAEKRPVNTFTIKEVSGLDYMAYYRNPEALALFRTHSTHLRDKREKESVKRHRTRRQHVKQADSIHEVNAEPRDPLLNYKKSVLVAKLRAAYADREQLNQGYVAVLQEHMTCGLTIARLEAQVAEFDAFMTQFRTSLNKQEHGM